MTSRNDHIHLWHLYTLLLSTYFFLSSQAYDIKELMNTPSYQHTSDFNKQESLAIADFQHFQTLSPENATVNDKLIATATLFVGRNYAFDTLGDGHYADFDPRPLLNTQHFDCLTYASMILAFLHSQTPEQLRTNLINVRYKTAEPAYFTKHHFMSTEWNFFNAQKGYLQDITAHITSEDGQPLAKPLHVSINKPAWLNYQKTILSKRFTTTFQKRVLKQQMLQAKVHNVTLWHIPIAAFFTPLGHINQDILNQIPNGTIVQFTSPNRKIEHLIGTRVAIAHLGFAYRINNVLMFQHASPDTKTVTTQPLADYLVRVRNHIHFLEGVHLQRIIT